jgi:hypothetical protein
VLFFVGQLTRNRGLLHFCSVSLLFLLCLKYAVPANTTRLRGTVAEKRCGFSLKAFVTPPR